MASLFTKLRGRDKRYTVDDYLTDVFSYSGHAYALGGFSASSDVEEIENSFVSYVQRLYKSNGVVYATCLARQLLFSEARFQFQEMIGGRPGNLFASPELSILESPWPNGTTGELLRRMDQDATTAGNFYVAREGRRLRRLRPDWVSIVLTAPPDEAVESDVAGYLYRPGGMSSKVEPRVYLPHEVTHWSPEPDPEAQYRGMSWLTPIIREIQSDAAATLHKKKFFDVGASPKLAVSFKESVTEQQFRTFMAAMREAHHGVDRAYEPLFLGGGADVTTVGSDLKQLDFKATQGAGETRITAAGGVPAVIVGLSEGLQAATYSNYGQARRKFGDHWARPQWRSASAALATVVKTPDTARLWYDDRDIAFLREDAKDQAEILSRQMLTIESGVRAGYTPESVRDAVVSGDLDRLIHTGLFSVQLQPPGTGTTGDTSVEGGQSEDDA